MGDELSCHDRPYETFVHKVVPYLQRYIQTQEELNKVSTMACNSGDFTATAALRTDVLKVAGERGLRIPAILSNSAWASFARSKNLSENHIEGAAGTVTLACPRAIDLERLVREFCPWAKLKVDNDGWIGFIDQHGEELFGAKFGAKNMAIAFRSSLERDELNFKLFWLPTVVGEAIRNVFSLPRPSIDDYLLYTDEKLREDSERIKNISGSGSVHEAVLEHCGQATNVPYPGFGVATENEKFSYLSTKGIYTCIGLVIHDHASGLALMAHMTAEMFSPEFQLDQLVNSYCASDNDLTVPTYKLLGDNLGSYGNMQLALYCDRMTFPEEWYIGTFKDLFFKDSKPENTSITIIASDTTSEATVGSLSDSLELFFSDFPITVKRSDHETINIKYRLDQHSLDIESGAPPRGYKHF